MFEERRVQRSENDSDHPHRDHDGDDDDCVSVNERRSDQKLRIRSSEVRISVVVTPKSAMVAYWHLEWHSNSNSTHHVLIDLLKQEEPFHTLVSFLMD